MQGTIFDTYLRGGPLLSSNPEDQSDDVQATATSNITSATDILERHHSKSASRTSFVNRLPDPSIMAEIRNGLEQDIFEAELVR